MKFIKSFFSQLKSSFFDPQFYSEPKTWWKSFSFLLTLLVMVAVVSVIFISKNVIPVVKNLAEGSLVDDFYPEGLVIDINNGIVSTNMPEPYIIADKEDDVPGLENFFVIDTREGVSLDTVDSYDSSVVLTRTSLFVKEENGQARIIPLKNVKRFTLNEENLERWFETAIRMFWIISIPMALGVFFFIVLFDLAFYLTFLLFGTLVTMLIARIRKRKISYKDAYILSIFALAPVVIVDVIRIIFGFYSAPLWAVSLVFLLVLIVNLRGPSSSSEQITETNLKEAETAKGEPRLHIVDIDALVQEFKENRISESLKMKYYIGAIVLTMLSQYLAIINSADAFPALLQYAILTFLMIGGIIWCYRGNLQGDGKDFLGRFIPISFIVSIRVTVVGFIIGFFVGLISALSMKYIGESAFLIFGWVFMLTIFYFYFLFTRQRIIEISLAKKAENESSLSNI